jgi:deazaflavin-dependent oxidoreductase (nitroreductase family)
MAPTNQTDQPTSMKNIKNGKSKKPGAFSRWMQHVMNRRMIRKVRRGKGTFMGMDVLILTTVGRRSGQSRETPVAWFPDGGDGGGSAARLVVASGGDTQHPDWFLNLLTHADQASIELPGADPTPVAPHRLTDADREQAWQRIAEAAPSIARYQRKSERIYPIVRLAPR